MEPSIVKQQLVKNQSYTITNKPMFNSQLNTRNGQTSSSPQSLSPPKKLTIKVNNGFQLPIDPNANHQNIKLQKCSYVPQIKRTKGQSEDETQQQSESFAKSQINKNKLKALVKSIKKEQKQNTKDISERQKEYPICQPMEIQQPNSMASKMNKHIFNTDILKTHSFLKIEGILLVDDELMYQVVFIDVKNRQQRTVMCSSESMRWLSSIGDKDYGMEFLITLVQPKEKTVKRVKFDLS